MYWRRRDPVIPDEQKKSVRQGYDKLSYAYRADDTPDDYDDYAAWVGILAERMPQRSPVLDIGCAMGFFTLPAAKMVSSDGKIIAGTSGQTATVAARKFRQKEVENNAHVVVWDFRFV